jgi:trehalose 6-phosphate phosphatase
MLEFRSPPPIRIFRIACDTEIARLIVVILIFVASCFMSPPDPTDPQKLALFFDFDGTLADIVEHPEDVEVTEATRSALAALRETQEGAVAIITGRDIATIDRFLSPVQLPVAGVHGLTRRDANGHVHNPQFDSDALSAIEKALEDLVKQETGLLLESKQGALALHYRQRPELEGVCLEAMEQAVNDTPSITIKRGKMVIEAVGHTRNKGEAIESFLAEAPFAGRMPVFAGDDLTDEDGFAMVNRLQGISIKVGLGDTQASYRVHDREELLSWLHAIIEKIGINREQS